MCAGIIARESWILRVCFRTYKVVRHYGGYDVQTGVGWRCPRVQAPVFTGLPFCHVAAKVCLPVGQTVDLLVQGRDAMVLWGHAH